MVANVKVVAVEVVVSNSSSRGDNLVEGNSFHLMFIYMAFMLSLYFFKYAVCALPYLGIFFNTVTGVVLVVVEEGGGDVGVAGVLKLLNPLRMNLMLIWMLTKRG